MKAKDQILLEEAYKKVMLESSVGWFRYKTGEPIMNEDIVRYEGNDKETYKVVGGNIYKNRVQLEVIEDVASGQSPRWIHVRPTQIVKISK